MDIQGLKDAYQSDKRSAEIIQHLSKGQSSNIHIKGSSGSAEAFIVSSVFNNIKGHHVCLMPDKESAIYFLNDLESLNPDARVYFFTNTYAKQYSKTQSTDSSNALYRSEVLNGINTGRSKMLIVTYPEPMMEKVATEARIADNSLNVKAGDQIPLDDLRTQLFDLNFESCNYVYEPGQFAIRGGIVDIFSFSEKHPYRIELFGNKIDSIRTFDPATQLSVNNVGKLTILSDLRIEEPEEGQISMFDLISKDTTIWVKDAELILDSVEKKYESFNNASEENENPEFIPEDVYIPRSVFERGLQNTNCIEFSSNSHFSAELVVPYATSPQPAFNKNFELLTQNLIDNQKGGFQNIILTKNAKQTERMYNLFEDTGKEVAFNSMVLPLNEGFIDKDLKLVCYTEHQIFNKYNPFFLRAGYQKTKQAITLKELNTLQPGDYVTHIDHGVGQFSGLLKIDVSGKKQEAIKIIYKDGDILYVSIHSLHRVSKYSGQEGKVPTLHKIGSKVWAKLKQKTKKRIKEIAFDIIKVYAKRKAENGFAYSPDTYLQTELEASFVYEDTPDQLQATIDVKKDMESDSPMDRLICGDVGFGKTEIAIRAAFKAVADSKQVAIMVPTTILTMQHFQTFQDRLKDFPCNIDFINRFRSTKEQKEVLEKLENGKTDIIIGTHRLAGNDVKFKDLGMMIVDEEQKFGVNTKDKLKTIKTSIDTLTLTATPIPRTLEFSMMGARDLSTLNTAPPNRQPIQTELHTFSERVIVEAIIYEMQRGGQVYFINNRIQNIEEISAMIDRSCPNVNIGVVHGRLKGPQMEKVMVDFIDGKFDVLVATSIVESGLDIPNVNTIIINNAHMFGLSDLHQLRGRVGRSNKKAFCHLLSPPLSGLTKEARTRLKTIEQFADLGSGFNIAMRDLDIRGAGDLLGGEQSGFINDLGFDTYQKILNEAIKELKEGEFKDLYQRDDEYEYVTECQIETDLEILFPDDYINSIVERLALYKELNLVKTEEQLDKYIENLIDRFGPIPPQGIELFNTIRLRWVARKIGLEKVVMKNARFIAYFVQDQASPYYESELFTRVLNHIQSNPSKFVMKEKNNKLGLYVDKIYTVQQGIDLLRNFEG